MSNLQNPIRIYDSTLTLVGELDDYQSAYFTRSWYGVGDFSIQINNNTVHAGDLQKGYFVMFGKDKYRFGLITKLDSKVDSGGKGSEIITASGFEVKFIYSWRIVLPQAGSPNYTLNNSAETVMKTLVKDQCGSTADVDRRFSIMDIATDLDRGSTYVLNVRYNSTVADELQKISIASNVGYFLYLDESNKKLIFEISEGVNRTATQSTNPRAIFSKDYDTLKSASFSSSDNQYRNYAYAAGQGVGTERTIREIYTTTAEPTGLSRKEIFIDARDLTGTGDIDARAAQKLGEYAIQLTVDGAPLTYSPLVYRTDYDLGDIVTIQALGTTYDARITSVKESWSPLVYDIDVTFDKEPASLPMQVSRANESVRSSISQTEGVIIESKTNSEGSYRLFSDGTMDVSMSWAYSVTTSSTSDGLNYADLPAKTFPYTFHSITGGDALLLCAGNIVLTASSDIGVSSITLRAVKMTSSLVSGTAIAHIMGRWRA